MPIRRKRKREVVGWTVQDALNRRQLLGRWASRYGLLAVLGGIIVLLTATDFIPGLNRFWREHQLVTAFATESVLILLVVFGLDSLLRARARRRWRPMGIWAATDLDSITDIGETISGRVHDYAHARYGTFEPEGREYYDDLLLEALCEPTTWAGGSETDPVEPLLDEVREMGDETERKFGVWAPVLIAEPELAQLAALLPRIIIFKRRLMSELEYAHDLVHSGRAEEWRSGEGSIFTPTTLAREAKNLDDLTSEVLKIVVAFRDDRPIRPLYADEAQTEKMW